jgi:hypothetical protein
MTFKIYKRNYIDKSILQCQHKALKNSMVGFLVHYEKLIKNPSINPRWPPMVIIISTILS